MDFGLKASIEAFCTIETAGLDTGSGGIASTRALETNAIEDKRFASHAVRGAAVNSIFLQID